MNRILAVILTLAVLPLYGAGVTTPAGKGTNNIWYNPFAYYGSSPYTLTPFWTNNLGVRYLMTTNKPNLSPAHLMALRQIGPSNALYLGDTSSGSGFAGLTLQVQSLVEGNLDPRITMGYGDWHEWRFLPRIIQGGDHATGGGASDKPIIELDCNDPGDAAFFRGVYFGNTNAFFGAVGTNFFFTNGVTGHVPMKIYNNDNTSFLLGNVTNVAGRFVMSAGSPSAGKVITALDSVGTFSWGTGGGDQVWTNDATVPAIYPIDVGGNAAPAATTNRVEFLSATKAVKNGTPTKLIYSEGGTSALNTGINTTTSNNIAPGQVAGVFGEGISGLYLNYGVIGLSEPTFSAGGTNVGVAGLSVPFGSDGVYVGGFFGVAADDSSDVKYENSALLADTMNQGGPILTLRTNNGTTLWQIVGNGDLNWQGITYKGPSTNATDGQVLAIAQPSKQLYWKNASGGAATFDPNQFGGPAGGTNIIKGSLQTNNLFYADINDLSIDVKNHKLWNNNPNWTVDWNLMQLRNNTPTVTVDWSSGTMFDNAAVPSVSWISRSLSDSVGIGVVAVDYGNRKLYKSDGTTVAIDWNASVAICSDTVKIDDAGPTRINVSLNVGTNNYAYGSNVLQVANATNAIVLQVGTNSTVYVNGLLSVTNPLAAAHRIVLTGTNIMITNGSGNWASLGYNSTNTGTNVSPYYGLISPDINVGTVDAGFRRESSSAVVLENPQGTLQKSLRVDSLHAGNHVESQGGIYIGTNAGAQQVITGREVDEASRNRHFANNIVVTNHFAAGTNALAGAGVTPSETYNTNYHTFAIPGNAVGWSILGDTGNGTNYINMAMIVSANNGDQTNRTEIRADSINQTNRATGNFIIGTNGQLVVSGPGTNYFGANVNVNGTVNATGVTNSALTASKVVFSDPNKALASTTATSSQLVAGDGSPVTVSTGLNLSGGNLTATGAGTASTNSFVVMTNGVLNNVNTNLSGGIQQVNFSAWNHTTGVNGRSSLILMVDQAGGTTFVRSPAEASIDTAVAVTLSQDYTNTCSTYLSNNATWYVTNATTGAGNDAGIIAGTFQVATLGGSGTVTSVGASGPAGFTWSSPVTGSGTLTATTPGLVVTNGNVNIFKQTAELDLTGTTNYIAGDVRRDGGLFFPTNMTRYPNFNKGWSLTNVAAAYTMGGPAGVDTTLTMFQQTLYTVTNTSGAAILVTLTQPLKKATWWGTNVTAFYVTNATTMWWTCRPGETNVYIEGGY